MIMIIRKIEVSKSKSCTFVLWLSKYSERKEEWTNSGHVARYEATTLFLPFRTLAVCLGFFHLCPSSFPNYSCLVLGKVSESGMGTTSQALLALFLSYLFFYLLSHGPTTLHIGRWFPLFFFSS